MAVRRVNGSGDDVYAAPAATPPAWARPYDEATADSDQAVTVPDQSVKVGRVKLAKVRSARGASTR